MRSTSFSLLIAGVTAKASAYLITGDVVNCRSGPGTSYSVVKQYTQGQDVTITCQTEGTNVNGVTIWDKTADGNCYVSDYYVQTGSDGYVTGRCGTSSCPAPKSNQATVDLIAEFEGFEPNVYIDPTGNPTIGYGHLCQRAGCSEVPYPIPLSQADGKRLLASDMARFEQCITAMITGATLNLNQYGALISWSFNMGCGAAQTSTLVARLNGGGNVNTVLSEELPRWVYGGGVVLPGLVRRRNAEVALSQTAGSGPALPVQC
ncbi:lysozyme-like domain-containing protein [Apiosordaria backusii]|uniref:Lysozyme-like domain-containing protein n=1 Tax=Apiosordaria backusii TaxID=314023 RepID=A0AA40DJ07_9PEZI|nr:lysozyme-like domain-containing protein [Apiosordaria backusii]